MSIQANLSVICFPDQGRQQAQSSPGAAMIMHPIGPPRVESRVGVPDWPAELVSGWGVSQSGDQELDLELSSQGVNFIRRRGMSGELVENAEQMPIAFR